MNWLDRIPSQERMRLRSRPRRSAAEYAQEREERLGETMEKAAEQAAFERGLAELAFALESEPRIEEALAKQVKEDIREQGMDALIEDGELSEAVRTAIMEGRMTISVSGDQLTVVPEGNIQEALPLKRAVSDQYVGQFVKDGQ